MKAKISLTREFVEKNEMFDRGRSSAPRTSSLSGLSSNCKSHKEKTRVLAELSSDNLLEVSLIWMNTL